MTLNEVRFYFCLNIWVRLRRYSDLRSSATLIEIFKEICLPIVFDFFVVGESLIPLYSASALWCNLVKNVATPDIILLDVVESLISSPNEVVDILNATSLIMLSPVICELKLCHLWVCVPSVAI